MKIDWHIGMKVKDIITEEVYTVVKILEREVLLRDSKDIYDIICSKNGTWESNAKLATIYPVDWKVTIDVKPVEYEYRATFMLEGECGMTDNYYASEEEFVERNGTCPDFIELYEPSKRIRELI